jgi:hypothetical protein
VKKSSIFEQLRIRILGQNSHSGRPVGIKWAIRQGPPHSLPTGQGKAVD